MNNYEIKKGLIGITKPFANTEAANIWAADYFGSGFTITDLGPVPQKTEQQKLEQRQQFGEQLVNKYLMDNDAIAKTWGRPFTPEETAQQAAKTLIIVGGIPVTSLQELLKLGSLKQALAFLQTITTDSIFTQERKDSYIAQLNAFISAQ